MLALFALLLSFSDAAMEVPAEAYATSLSTYHAQHNFHGAVLVATHGQVDYEAAIGIGNRTEETPITTESRFRVASMSKLFTAVLVMKLVEQGNLDLESTLDTYLPNYNGPGKASVTLHHLLTYSSGIENQLDSLGMVPYQKIESLEDFIVDYCSGDPVAPAGERSEYGNTDYILLHAILERVTGRRYGDLLREVILDPLDMTDTGIATAASASWLPAYTYDDSLEVFEEEAPYYPEMYFGAGSLYSTLEDLLAFDQALFESRLLSKESTETLLTIHPEYGYTAYGMWGSTGWGNFAEPFYYRTGGILGSNANWIHTMDGGKTILVLSNTNATNLYALSEALYLISVGKDSE